MLKNKKNLLLAASFAVPCLIMFVIFIIQEIYPFGERSFLATDLYHQYLPFFSEFMRKIRAGEGLAYSYNVGIGSNFLALYVYYLASPLHWLGLLVPEAYQIEFLSYLVIIKIGLCGLTSAYYFQKHFKADENMGVLLFSCFYALSGFLAAYNWNIMWLDCVILLPVILLGLEMLVKENKCRLYCVALALSIYTNFYISIMICIFLALYFLVLFVNNRKSLRMIWNFAAYSLLAAGMAAVLLIPVACALMETDFGDMNFPKKIESYFSVLDMLARHGMCVSVEKGLDHWPNIYCGAAVFMMIPMYVMNHKISIRERFCHMALAGFMLLGFSTNVLNFIWHGFNYPDSLPARQSFIYVLLILIMCYSAYHHIMEAEPKHILYGYLCAVLFILFCEEFINTDDFAVGVEWLTLLFISIYAVLLYLYRTRADGRLRQYIALVALFAVVAENGINTLDTSVPTTSRPAYLEGLEDYAALYETARDTMAEEGQTPFFRIEKFIRKTKNDGTLVGYPTASVFSSTMNSYVMDMYTELGMLYSKVYYGYDGATFFTSALLNVEFMYGENAREEGPLYTHLADSGKISLYRANYTLPFGYVAPTGYNLAEESINGLRLQNAMVSALGVQGTLFKKQQASQVGEDVQFTAENDGYYYGIVTASGTKKVKFTTDKTTRTYQDLKNKIILHLGYLEAGTVGTLTNNDDSDGSQTIKLDIYRMDEEVLKEALDVLGKESMYNVTYDSTHIEGEVDLAEAGRLILSVPYEKGWTVLLDGEEVEPKLFGGTLMALDLEAGHHTVELNYRPYGSILGIAVSIISIGIFVTVIVLEKRSKQGKKDPKSEEAAEVVIETM